jgi:hypothetical protein
MHIDFFNAHLDDIISELPISCFFCTILGKRGKSSPESVLQLNKTYLLSKVTKLPDYLEKEQVDEMWMLPKRAAREITCCCGLCGELE